MRRNELLRASDADRDAVTDRLRRAAGEGRLETEELEERVDAALRARTYGELGRLVSDLPPDGEATWRGSRLRGAALARFALIGVGLVAAITLAVVVVAMVVLVVLAVLTFAAMAWITFVVFWLVFCRSRRRGVPRSVWRHDAGGHVGRAKATGFL
jgi:Flp pilus assembly protein TadB